MRILLFGHRGYLGGYLQKAYPEAILSDLDIADKVAVTKAFDELKPDVIINAAGKTGRPNVDWCEENKLETVRSNVTGPLILLEECIKRDVYMVHLGSGCMYEGTNGGKGFTEEDPPNFSGSFYARSKAWSDQILKDFPVYPDGTVGVLQLRLRMPFDGSDHPRNLISKLKRYTKVLDEPNSLTYLPDFINAAKALIKKRKTGIYNIVNPGTISPYDIMVRYQKMVDPAHQFEKLVLRDLSEVVKAGRSNCLLSSEKVLGEGVKLRGISEAVDRALEEMPQKKR